MVAAGFTLLIGLGAAFGGGTDDTTSSTSSSDEQVESGTTTTSAVNQEQESAAPSTEAPGTTRMPTTQASTTSTAALPEPTLPSSVVAGGQGDSITEVPASADSWIVTLTHDGGSNFVVEALDSALNVIDLLVNEIGAYAGVILIPDGTARLGITADGAWNATYESLLAAPEIVAEAPKLGQGDAVLLLLSENSYVADISHDGESNFVVQTLDDLLVNEIGSYNGQAVIRGRTVVIVTADGNWSITLNT
jgi:hypothetical protein